MGYQHPSKKNVTAAQSVDRHKYIKARADRINLSVSEYAGLWWDEWFRQDAPNLHTLEKNLPHIPVPKECR